jgi:hypothetical protein
VRFSFQFRQLRYLIAGRIEWEAKGATVNLTEGARRLALLLGVAGAILGGFASYTELQSVLGQRARHIKFEQLANSAVVKQARKQLPIDLSAGGIPDTPQNDIAQAWLRFDENRRQALLKKMTPEQKTNLRRALDQSGHSTSPDFTDVPPGYTITDSEVDKGGIKSIQWTKEQGVRSIETEEGQTLYPTRAPAGWTYLLIALLPILGFFIPWGAVRAVGWVAVGFIAGPK